MTPQLQQAIRLLQLSTLDLQNEIQEAIDSNPLLEISEEGDQDSTTEENEANKLEENNQESNDPVNNIETSYETKTSEGEQINDIDSGDPSKWETDIPEELAVDTAWDDIYPTGSSLPGVAEFGDLPDFEATMSSAESISDHLLWQLNLTPMSEVDQIIAMAIIDATGGDGYLTTEIESLLEAVNGELNHSDQIEQAVELDEIEAVLHRLQHFDPVGVCARDLSECLAIQLNQFPEDTKWLAKAKELVDNHLGLLGSRDFTQLKRRTKLKDQELQEVINLIQSLNPKPGEVISLQDAEYIVPDVTVKKEKGRWLVELNPDTLPKVQINSTYAAMVKRADNSSDNTYIRNHLQDARWFLKSLLSRNETLLKVASEIVDVQRGFLEYGEEAMKPLVLHDVAKAVEMHESTISRVTTQKYMHTPRGIFELKYFFSSQVDTESGLGCSSTAIRAIIKKLVAAEKTTKPLSDSKIALLLGDQGIKVARRTITKYRESMSIPPSNERKQLT